MLWSIGSAKARKLDGGAATEAGPRPLAEHQAMSQNGPRPAALGLRGPARVNLPQSLAELVSLAERLGLMSALDRPNPESK
jgi:hypothetical protein